MANPYRSCFKDPGVAGVPSQYSQAFRVPVLAHLSTEPSLKTLNLNNLEKKAQTQEMFANHVSDGICFWDIKTSPHSGAGRQQLSLKQTIQEMLNHRASAWLAIVPN